MGQDFIAGCYEVLLGRERAAAPEDARDRTRLDVLRSTLGGSGFTEAVAAPVLERRPWPKPLFAYPLTLRHRRWLAAELPILPSTGLIAMRAANWRAVIALVLNDPLLGLIVDAPRLRRGAQTLPALQALDQMTAALRRPLQAGGTASRDFAEVLATFCGETFDRFESVGDNCEFGGLQRAVGLESLGLFRWSGVRVEPLVRMLDSNLVGVDDPTNVSLQVTLRDNGSAEYMLEHSLFGADAHTFTTPQDAAAPEVLARELKRLGLLQRKFREDLRTGRRIFVHRSSYPLGDAAAFRLHEAFLRHGPNRLPVVRPADQGRRPGEVALLRTGLAVATLDDFALGMEKYSELWPCVLMRAERLLADAAGVRVAA